MGVIAWIVIGLLAGWLAAKLTGSPRGLLRNLAVGFSGRFWTDFYSPGSAYRSCPISGAS
jgi:uncharacterized membrane protein YeaQ/YmgE (transglycosylase-associated protein family)